MMNILNIAPYYCCLETAGTPFGLRLVNYLDHGSIAVKGIYLIVEIYSQFTVLVNGIGRACVLHHRGQSNSIQIPIEQLPDPAVSSPGDYLTPAE